MSDSLLQNLAASLASRLSPAARESVVEFVEGNLILPQRFTSKPGPVTLDRHPYCRRPLDLFADPRATDLVFKWATQVAKTTLLMLGVSWRIKRRPGPTLWVFPDDGLVRRFNRKRWRPFLQDNPIFADEIPRSERGNINFDLFALGFQLLNSMDLQFAHSNSPGALSSDPVEWVIFDEIDKGARASKREAASHKLADERTKTYPATGKRIKASTPTDEESIIEEEYEMGTQEGYFVLSPFAPREEPFTLDWRNEEESENDGYRIAWDSAARRRDGSWDYDKVRESAYYRCPRTGDKILDYHKPAMNDEGQWVARNENPKPGYYSFHLPTIYSPDVSFGDLALKWIEANQSLIALQNFINSALAEIYTPYVTDKTDVPIGNYSFADVTEPRDPLGLDPRSADFPVLRSAPAVNREVDLLTIDVQKAGFYVIARRWDLLNGNSRLLHHATPESIKTDDDLIELTKSLGILKNHVGIDHGYKGSSKVNALCSKHRWLALKGDEAAYFVHQRRDRPPINKPIARKKLIDPYEGTAKQGKAKPIALYLWSNPGIYNELAALKDGRGSRFEVPVDISKAYTTQLKSWSLLLKRRPTSGRRYHEWGNPSKKPDHFWDCECMQIVMAHRWAVPIRILPLAAPDDAPPPLDDQDDPEEPDSP